MYVRFHVTGQISVDPPSNVEGSSDATARLAGGLGFMRSWNANAQLKDEPLPIDEEIVMPVQRGHWNTLLAYVDVDASSSNNRTHAASARMTYTILGIEDGSGTEIQGVVLETGSGFDYGLGGG
ncbi:MAG TPA: hypothetical protein VFQ22_01560 [Longimicrobiales bacterium]|nr:hypothetical protein [Longimicrobiales bacterium]